MTAHAGVEARLLARVMDRVHELSEIERARPGAPRAAAVCSVVMVPNESAWTHELRIRMPPRAQSLRTFGHFIEALDGLDGVRWRSIAEGSALLAVGTELQVRVGLSTIELLAYRTTLGGCASPVLDLLEELIAPPMALMSSRSQHLAALNEDVDYAVATERAARQWLGPVHAIRGLRDCAVLLDGDVPEVDASYQVEYGVVQGSEVYERLLRVFGRVDGGGLAPEPAGEGDAYPDVAVFADFTWQVERPMRTVAGPEGCLARASRMLEYADEFVAVLNEALAAPTEGGGQ